MHIQRLKITNYKCFAGEHVINFPKDKSPVLLVGVNGAGKTTILESILAGMNDFFSQLPIKPEVDTVLLSARNVSLGSGLDARAEISVEWNTGKALIVNGFKVQTEDENHTSVFEKDLVEYVEELKGDVRFYGREASIPVFAYYPVERLVINPSYESTNASKLSQFQAYHGALASSLDFDDFFDWFRSSEDLENEIRLNKDTTFLDPGLSAVRYAIISFMDGFTKVRVRRTNGVALLLEKNGQEFEINQLSHGEKAVISLVGDLARRLVIANPGRKNPLTGQGVVLIDELDLHLHPRWQREILHKLTNTFPNIQFICTTHSTVLLSQMKSESIFVLEDGKCTPLSERFSDFKSYGAKVEEVIRVIQGLEELMPEDVKNLFSQLNKAIAEGNTEIAQDYVELLRTIVGANQPDLRAAENRMRYKDLLND